MNLQDLKKPLEIKDIDFRVQSVNKGGYATILAYKDARVDMNRLDEVCGAEYWKREHFDGNTRCKVSVWNEKINEWISKEDVGTASMTEKEKGLASDSFKRACFNWGIGRELYDYPIIQVKLNDSEFDKATKKPTWNFKLKEWKWTSEFKDGKLVGLSATDNNGQARFSFGTIKNLPKLDAKGLAFLTERGTIKHIEDAFEFREITPEQKILLDKKLKELKN